MSNLQDIPLAELSDNSMPSTGHDTSTPKSNSLKRFFKLGNKKPATGVGSCEDVLPEANQEAASGGGAVKANTLSRFFTRMKGNQRQDGLDVAAAMSKSTANFTTEPEAENLEEVTSEESSASTTGKPVPNTKPTTLKTSISTYWKLLFHRQKANLQSRANSAEAQQSVRHVDEVHELEMVPQELEQDDDIADSPNPALAAHPTVNMNDSQ